MAQDNELIKNRSHLAISTVALLFCIVWALVGESDIKIVAVFLAFSYFLKSAVDTEMSARALEDH